jgi:hypothetical protein
MFARLNELGRADRDAARKPWVVIDYWETESSAEGMDGSMFIRCTCEVLIELRGSECFLNLELVD